MKTLRILLLAFVAISISFTSCKNDEPTPEWYVDAQVRNSFMSNSAVDSVYAVAGEVDSKGTIVGRAKYEKGGFKMKLSAIPESGLIATGEVSAEGVTVSNENVKIGAVAYYVGVKDGEYVGYFFFTKFTLADIIKVGLNPMDALANGSLTVYVYANADVTIKGTTNYFNLFNDFIDAEYISKATLNLTLKQGWNLVELSVLSKTNLQYEVELKNLIDTKNYSWIFVPFKY